MSSHRGQMMWAGIEGLPVQWILMSSPNYSKILWTGCLAIPVESWRSQVMKRQLTDQRQPGFGPDCQLISDIFWHAHEIAGRAVSELR